MPSDLQIASSHGSYTVSIGEGTAEAAMSREADVVVVDRAVRRLLPPTPLPVLELAASEETKTLAGAETLIAALRDAGVRRGDHVVAVGGGVVQDLTTFTASIYMRGIPWTYLPTTLMAMADSCIGGKSSINAAGVKNLVGNFHPPTRVAVDPRFLPTLSSTARSAGLAEAVKIAFCRGDDAFAGYLDRYRTFDARPADLLVHVLSAKQWFVEVDEHDVKERRLLNLGHTFGHALEVAVDHRVPHGVAVAVGILCAIRHPAAADGASVRRLEEHCRELLGQVDDLHALVTPFDDGAFERAFRTDKKHAAGSFHLILPAPGEGVAEVTTGDGDADWSVVRDVTHDVLDSVRGPR